MDNENKTESSDYSAIFDAANDGIIIHDIETLRVVDVNRKACEMYCYPKEEMLVIGIKELCSGEGEYTIENFTRYAEKVSRGEPQLFEWLTRDKAGRFFWVEANLRRAVIGGKYRFLSIVRDISERKRTEERLKRINETFLSFNKNISENINRLTALAGELLNADCAIYSRLEDDHLLACGQWNVPPDFKELDKADGHICYDVLRQAKDDMVFIRNLQDTEYARTDPNVAAYKLQTYLGHAVKFGGTYVGTLCVVYKYDYVSTEEDRKIMGVISSAIGVEEERRSAEDILKFAHFSIDKAGDTIFWVGSDAHILYANDMACNVLGYSHDELSGKTLFDIDPNLTEKKWHECWSEAKKNGIITIETANRKKDGRTYPAEFTLNFIDFEGEEYGFAFVHDITDRKNAENALLRRDYQLEVLSRTSQHINAVLDIPVIVRTLITAAMEVVGATAGMGGVFKNDKMVFNECNIGGHLESVNYQFEKGHGIPGWVANEMKPYISNEAANDKQILPAIREKFNLYNIISVPIIGGNKQLLGCFEIYNKENREPFDIQDAFMLKGLAANAAVALENAQTLAEKNMAAEALRESEEKYRKIVENSNDVIMLTDSGNVIVYLSPACSRVLGYDPEELIGKALWIIHEDDVRRVREAFGQALKGSGGTNFEYRILTRRAEVKWVSHSWAPITKDGKVQLVVSVIRDVSEAKKSSEQLRILYKELTKSNKQLGQLALRDSQTGLYNHRYLSEVIESEFYRTRRYAHPLSVIMLDIDYFKSINDMYGHDFGDMVLKQLAGQIKRLVRRYDIVVRYGGEEFVVLSPGTDRTKAIAQAQRLLDAVNMHNFGDKEHSIKLKVSIAVASYPEDPMKKGIDLISTADMILNKVKKAGGNNVYSSVDIAGRKTMPEEDIATDDVKFLKKKIESLTKSGRQNLIASIFAFAKTIELRDHYTGKHVESTVRFATAIAKKLNLSEEDLENVRQAAVLHDLGKIGISDRILHKRSKLTVKEFEAIKKHPQIAADIIRPIQFMHDIVPLVLYHHERWDGKGYPAGLKEEEIPIGARIIAIADVYQALISNRPYRKAFSKQKAIEIIQEGSGTQFDPRIVDIFVKYLKKES